MPSQLLQRRTAPAGVVFYASPLLEAAGVPHAFSTRLGGLSPAPFDSLNLGNPNGCAVQDDYERIWENYRLLQRAAGCGGGELVRVHQVHGAAVAVVTPGKPFDVSTKADALVGNDPSRVLSVRVADCVPVLLASRDGRTVAAVHAGWRGVVAGAVGAAMRAMAGIYPEGCRPADLLVAIGPNIGFDAFEVGPEVLERFEAMGHGSCVRHAGGGKGHADLRQSLRLQCREAGVPDDQIDTTDRCTYRDRDEFFSHRRENGVTGRMAAIIAPRAGIKGRG